MGLARGRDRRSPETALLYVHELITRMLRERGILDSSLAVTEGADPEYVRMWRAGADLVAGIEDPGVDVEREDVVEAIENYRLLFGTARRRARIALVGGSANLS